MGTYRLPLVLLALAGVASAQQSAADTFRLEGVVINAVTGKPLPRAAVQLNPGRAVLTDAEGQFAFDNVRAGYVRVEAIKPGFFAPGTTRQNNAVVEATAGSDSGKIVVKLAPEVLIWGQVTGREEEPLEGVQVQVMTYTFMNGREQLNSVGGAQTDENGDYRISGLPAGRYLIKLNAANFARRVLGARSATRDETYPPLYYPETTDFNAASRVDLAPGQRLEASFSVLPVPAFEVTGTVLVPPELKQLNPPLVVDGNGQFLYSVDRWDPSSRAFQFHLPAGSYILQMTGRDLQERSLFSEQVIAISQPVSGLKLTLQPGVDIPLVVHTEFANPPQTCPASHEDSRENCVPLAVAHAELVGVDGTRGHFTTDYGPQRDPMNYGIHNVAPGKYKVFIRSTVGGYVQAARCGSLDLLREPLVVPAGGSVGVIDITLRDDAASLKVAVRAEQPLQHGLVLLVPDGVIFPEPRAIGGGRGLTFQYGALAPGTYKVYAFDSNAVDYNNPEFLAKYASSAGSIRLEANDNASIAVDVIHTGE